MKVTLYSLYIPPVGRPVLEFLEETEHAVSDDERQEARKLIEAITIR